MPGGKKHVTEKDVYIAMIIEYYEKLEKESITLGELELFSNAIAEVLLALDREQGDAVEFNPSLIRADLLQMKEDIELEKQALQADPDLAAERQERSDEFDDEALLAVEAGYGSDDIDPEEEARHALAEEAEEAEEAAEAAEGEEEVKKVSRRPSVKRSSSIEKRKHPRGEGEKSRPATARSASRTREKKDTEASIKRRKL